MDYALNNIDGNAANDAFDTNDDELSADAIVKPEQLPEWFLEDLVDILSFDALRRILIMASIQEESFIDAMNRLKELAHGDPEELFASSTPHCGEDKIDDDNPLQHKLGAMVSHICMKLCVGYPYLAAFSGRTDP